MREIICCIHRKNMTWHKILAISFLLKCFKISKESSRIWNHRKAFRMGQGEVVWCKKLKGRQFIYYLLYIFRMKSLCLLALVASTAAQRPARSVTIFLLFFIHKKIIKWTVLWNVRDILKYIIWKLSFRPFVAHHKILFLLKGNFVIYKKLSHYMLLWRYKISHMEGIFIA